MFWVDCLRIMTCGFFGPPEDDGQSERMLDPQKLEVKYTFAIEDSSSDGGSDDSCDLDPSKEWDAAGNQADHESTSEVPQNVPQDKTPLTSDSDSDSPWEVLDETQ